MLLCISGAWAQGQGVVGKVIDSDGKPVAGAIVTVKEQPGVATVTNAAGLFRVAAQIGQTLLVSFMGYHTQEYALGVQSEVTISLETTSGEIGEVVVVGYGAQRKGTLVGSVSVVKNRELVQAPVANISNALVGRVPGLSSVQFSGEAGDNAASIYIRGVATTNADGTAPLVMLDGVESSIATMNALDANEIESINVLKDASATAVFGVKGANGVILITTKRGKSGKAKVDVSYRFGLTQLVSKLDMLGSEQYAILRNEAIHNDADPTKYQYLFTDDDIWKFHNGKDYTENEIRTLFPWLTPEQKTALWNSPALYYTDNDYYDQQFGSVAPQHQFNVNISGGDERMKYFTSVGYFTQDGLFRNADYMGTDNNSRYGRYNFRSNIDLQLIKNFDMSIDIGGIISENQGIIGNAQDGESSAYGRHKAMLVNILAVPPYSGPGIVGGKLVEGYELDATNGLHDKGGGGYSPINSILNRAIIVNRQSDISSTLRMKHSMSYLTGGLSASGTFSYSDYQRKGIRIQRSVPTWRVTRDPNNPAQLLFDGGILSTASVSDQQEKTKWNRFYLEGKIDYNRTFGRHAVTGLVLYNAQLTRAPWLSYQVPEGRVGLVGRITYGYDNRYLAEVNMGYNGSENFPEGKRFGFFPAFSAGWVATNEKFWPRNDWVTMLKLRGSYGEVGNDQIGGRRFLYLPSTWSTGNWREYNGYWWGNGNGSTNDMYYDGAGESTVGNPNVTWERARKTNAGVDLNMFMNRLNVVFDWFNEDRSNILHDYLSATDIIGISPAPGNIAKVNNKGYEIQVTWTHSVAGFTYSVGGGMSYARNKVIFMDEPLNPYPWMNYTGYSLNMYRGMTTSGFYNNDQEASNRPYIRAGGNMVRPGDIRFIDLNGDGIIDNNDMSPLGYSNLPRCVFNATLNIEWRGIYVSALFTGSARGMMNMDNFYILNPFYMTNGAALQWHYDERWTPERAAAGEKITFPRMSLANFNTQNALPSDMWTRSSQFFRLKNLEIGWSLPSKWLQNTGVGSVRVFASGNNLATWGSQLISGYDPEQADWSGASSGYLYPPTRSYNMGLNISF